MPYALLAATALGAIGLYLMLPRERAPLVRIGGLTGALALAALFLLLVRAADHGLGGAHDRPPVYFYLFTAIMIAGAVGVICQPRPVYAALYFVLVTLAGAGLFVLLLAEFMAVVLIIIYAGAILVTYVFVIMLASQGSVGGAVAAPAYDKRSSGGLIAIVVSFVLVGTITQMLLPSPNKVIAAPGASDQMMVESLSIPEPATEPHMTASSVQLLGINLYSQYAMSLELAGILLTIALIGAVVIARKNSLENQPLVSGKLPAA
jgi:NADH-quinone oxidoreductase subunit J